MCKIFYKYTQLTKTLTTIANFNRLFWTKKKQRTFQILNYQSVKFPCKYYKVLSVNPSGITGTFSFWFLKALKLIFKGFFDFKTL